MAKKRKKRAAPAPVVEEAPVVFGGDPFNGSGLEPSTMPYPLDTPQELPEIDIEEVPPPPTIPVVPVIEKTFNVMTCTPQELGEYKQRQMDGTA